MVMKLEMIDYVIIALYFLFVIGIGVMLKKGQKQEMIFCLVTLIFHFG